MEKYEWNTRAVIVVADTEGSVVKAGKWLREAKILCL